MYFDGSYAHHVQNKTKKQARLTLKEMDVLQSVLACLRERSADLL